RSAVACSPFTFRSPTSARPVLWDPGLWLGAAAHTVPVTLGGRGGRRSGSSTLCEVRRLRRGGRGEDFFRCCEGVFAVGGDQADAGAAVEEVGGVEGAFVLYRPEEVAAGQAEADRFGVGFDEPQG